MSNKEKNNLLKLVIGMAIQGYRYNPYAAHSTVIAEISKDLEVLHLDVGSQTIRTRLQEAKELLDQNIVQEILKSSKS